VFVAFPVQTRPFLITVAAAVGFEPAARATPGIPDRSAPAATAPDPARNVRRSILDDDMVLLPFAARRRIRSSDQRRPYARRD
jgi:hypothetical protein